ncbi:MAG: hypothetical protein ABJQ29_12940 [Luteolibacter sp.]
MAINKHDQILGATFFGVGEPRFHLMFTCLWDTPQSIPNRISLTTGGKIWYADQPSYTEGDRGVNIFTDNGEFHAEPLSLGSGDPPALDDDANYLWTLGSETTPTTAVPAPMEAKSMLSPDLRWGVREEWMDPTGDPDMDAPGGRAFIGGVAEILPFIPLNVIPHTTPGGTVHIATPLDADAESVIFHDGEWKPSTLLAQAIDIAADGTAISRRDANDTTFPDGGILLNGKWTSLSRAAPGLPATWTDDTSVFLEDTTPSGWILASNNSGPDAAMLPLRLKGIPGQDIPGLLSIAEATGVDDVSIGASVKDPAAEDRLWIMAPAISGETNLTIHAPIHSSAPLWLSATGVRLNDNVLLKLESESTPVAVHYTGTTSGNEILGEIMMGTTRSLSTPIGFKVMKQRTVRIAVYLVNKQTPGSPTVVEPNLVTAAEILQNYLNLTFNRQINVDIEIVNPDYSIIEASWDVNKNGYLDCYGPFDAPSPEQQAVMDLADDTDPPRDLTIFFMGGGIPILKGVEGYAHINSRTIWITADSIGGLLTLEKQPRVVAHEIGHFIFGGGHPDTGTGPAPLPGTNRQKRLMVSGRGAGDTPGILTVKGEWDAADVNLRVLLGEEE